MSLHASNIDKPIDPVTPDTLPDASHEDIANGLSAIVDHSAEAPNVTHHIHTPIRSLINSHWIKSLIPGIEKLAVDYHCGNYVIVRGSTEPFFETMPLYARLGMHLLFYGKEQIVVLGTHKVDQLLRQQSIKQGQIYDDPKSAASIHSFIETYSIQIDELLEPDITKYKNFNEFFYRKLKPDARPVQNEDDKSVIVSAADCRLTVFTSIDLAKAFWVKGQNFNVPNLLNLPPDSPKAESFQNASIAIFRLAPADYHRFHCPIDCEVGDIENVPGHFYTVNPQAINEPGFDVLTANTRSILYLKHIPTGQLVAYVAVGALLVGSIQWTGGKEKGAVLKRGDELGYFAYGGSTIVIVFPKEIVEFDEDLVSNSQKPIETLVKVGYSIGKTVRA
ncbi:Phosphatidylserine decarboxylase proenzyme 2 [Psilocybe cubensis]|uniref:Phosphatidylserine decarboxylase proenzyme 2 n=2 Tax=Psilocybe cubensis TaxID=181762 RepID=A0ACB8GV24_PSICU|nr:Phosphatidylserine decarboxylase proenzyme 2 [Psilocybe cubensis]KAH9479481.1 Phosphatidylserine decarboxylase proenzyme 2 [Psilocybe cubensis]